MKKQKGKLHNGKNLLKACSTHRNTKTGSFATAPTRQASPCLEFSIPVLLCKTEARKKAAHRRNRPPAWVAASQTLGLSTNFGSVRATDYKEPLGRSFANFSAGAWRSPANSLTPLPGSAAGRRTWGRGHPGSDGSRRRPGSHGSEGPGGATRGSWVASAGWDPGLAAHNPLVCPSVRPGTGPARRSGSERSFTVRLRGPPSARHDPHYCFLRRCSADGTALRPAPAACATPSRLRGERWGHLTVPGPHVPAPARGLQPPSATRARTAPPRAPPATPRASHAPPRGTHGPVRPASPQPLQTHPLVDAGAGPRGARGWG